MKRSYAKEMMDLPEQECGLLEDDLRNLRLINRYLGNHRCVLKGFARLLHESRPDSTTLLDIGTGSGDIPLRLLHWARSRGIALRVIAIDYEETTVGIASRQASHEPAMSVVRADAKQLPVVKQGVDFVLASQFLHHFTDLEIIKLLRSWAKLARVGIIISDLVRHPLAYHGIRILTRLCTGNVMTRVDAPLSVQRSLTLPEWRELFRAADVGPFELRPVLPFRQVTTIRLRDVR